MSCFACWKALSTSCSLTLLTTSKLGMSHLQYDRQDHRPLLEAFLPDGAHRAAQRLFHHSVIGALGRRQLGECVERRLPSLRHARVVETGHALAKELRPAHHFAAFVIEDAEADEHAGLCEE